MSDSAFKALSDPTRREILRLLGDGLGLPEIAAATQVSYKTVANSCSIIKRKLGARSAMDLLRIALEQKRA